MGGGTFVGSRVKGTHAGYWSEEMLAGGGLSNSLIRDTDILTGTETVVAGKMSWLES